MDQQQQPGLSLFDLSVDGQSKILLKDTARWAKFLSIVGFVFCALILLGGLAFAMQPESSSGSYDRFAFNNEQPYRLGPAMVFVYIALAVLYFIPCLFLFRFSNQMKMALQSGDQATLTTAFRNLRAMFRFVGILTIVLLSVYVIGIVVIAANSGQ